MSAFKIVQNLPTLSVAGTGIVTSTPIALKSGYLRIVPEQNTYIELGTTPVVNTSTSIWIPANGELILKETVRSQPTVGIQTGATTTITVPSGTGCAFEVGDYVSLSGISPAGINTNFARVSNIDQSTSYDSPHQTKMVLSWDTSSQGPVTVPTGEVRKVTRVAAYNDSGSSSKIHITEVQVVSNFS